MTLVQPERGLGTKKSFLAPTLDTKASVEHGIKDFLFRSTLFRTRRTLHNLCIFLFDFELLIAKQHVISLAHELLYCRLTAF